MINSDSKDQDFLEGMYSHTEVGTATGIKQSRNLNESEYLSKVQSSARDSQIASKRDHSHSHTKKPRKRVS